MSDTFNPDSLSSWNVAYNRIKTLLVDRTDQEVSRSQLLRDLGHLSFLHGEVRDDRGAEIRRRYPDLNLFGFWPQFLLNGWVSMATEKHPYSGTGFRTALFLPVENPNALPALAERLLITSGGYPSIPLSSDVRDQLRDLCMRPILLGKMFGSEHARASEVFVDKLLNISVAREKNQIRFIEQIKRRYLPKPPSTEVALADNVHPLRPCLEVPSRT